MSRSMSMIGVVAAIAVSLVLLGWWKTERDTRSRAARHAAIRALLTTNDSGWVQVFDTPRTQRLADLDPRWRSLFGEMMVDRRLGAAIGDPEGGWERDGGDDYSYRLTDTPTGSVRIVVDGWWDGVGSIGTQGAVQSQPPHQLYEAALWRGRLALIYFVGPTPDKFEVLAESSPLGVGRGHYRLELCMLRRGTAWQLAATLKNPDAGYSVIGRISAADSRLGEGGQGIGLLGGGGPKASHISGIAVRAIPDDAASDSTRRCDAG